MTELEINGMIANFSSCTEKGEINFTVDETNDYNLYFDLEPQCCEQFGIDFEGDYPNCGEYYNIALLNAEDGMFLEFNQNDRKVCSFEFYNIHNGYYAHDLSVTKNGQEVYNNWI